jgi:hypothetical protein
MKSAVTAKTGAETYELCLSVATLSRSQVLGDVCATKAGARMDEFGLSILFLSRRQMLYREILKRCGYRMPRVWFGGFRAYRGRSQQDAEWLMSGDLRNVVIDAMADASERKEAGR